MIQQDTLPYVSVDNRYVLKKQLGEGTTSTVYLAEDTLKGTNVAIKIAKTIGFADFAEENNISETLTHRSFLRSHGFNLEADFLTDTGEHEKGSFIIFEPALGGEMFDHLTSKKRFPELKAKQFVAQLLDAVESMHA